LKKYILIAVILIIISTGSSVEVPFSNSPVYSEQNMIGDFLCCSPPDSTEIPLKTYSWLWHDDNYLYLSWDAEINDDFMIGKYSPYDVSVQADKLNFQIITDNVNLYAYGFIAYPLGNKTDFIRTTSHTIDYDWDSAYDYTSERLNSKWKVVMRIPFKDLRFSGKPPYNWKIILQRYILKEDRLYTTPYLTTQMGKDYFRDAIDITINKEIKKNRNFYLRPYAIIKTDLKENNTEFDLSNFGLDLSLKPSNSSQLKFTYNPDFSDVPIDDEVNDFNSKYASFNPENRYFFIKDLNALGVSSTLFYSRQIVQPDFAVKYTGRTDNFTYGILSSKVKEVTSGNLIVDSDDLYNIFACKPSTGNFNFQITLLNRMNDKYHNEVLHLEPNWEFKRGQYFWMDLNLSAKDTAVDDLEKGYFGTFGYDYNYNNFKINFSTTQMSEDYAVDMGRIYEDDYYGWNLNTSLKKDFNNYLRSIYTNVNVSEEIDNNSNELLERYAHFDIKLETDYHFDLEIDCVSVKELYYEKYFDKYQLSLQATWNKARLFNLFLGFNLVNYIVYDLQEDYEGYYTQFGLSGLIHKYISYTFTADNMIYENLPDVDFVDDNYWLANLDVSISPSNSLDLTSGIRFNNYEYYDQSHHIGLFSNLRWQFRKRSFIYIGYNSASNKINNTNEFEHQQAYFKISYAF